MTEVKISEKLMKRYPKATKHYQEWNQKYRYDNKPFRSWGRNPLWLLEELCRDLNLKKGMRVLDLTQNDVSSIFLAKEYGVQVWSVSGVPSSKLIREANVENLVYPIKMNTKYIDSPFANEFFDVIINADNFNLYGTSDLYLWGLQDLVKKNGQIGIVVPGLTTEITFDTEKEYSEELLEYLHLHHNTYHTSEWWKYHWDKSHLVKVDVAENIEDCEEVWFDTSYTSDTKMLSSIEDDILTFVKIIATRV